MLKGRTVGIIGGNGWLGRAIGGPLLKAGFIDAGSLTLSCRPGQPSDFGGWPEVHWTSDNKELTGRSDVIIVSVRPEQFPAVAIDARERRDIGGASDHSYLGARPGLGFKGLTLAGTPNVSTLPCATPAARGAPCPGDTVNNSSSAAPSSAIPAALCNFR